MKGIVYVRYGSPDCLELMDLEAPAPRAGEVLVRVHAASANALDYRRFEKQSALGRLMDERLARAVGKVLGADIAGTVQAVGPGVETLSVGDEVFGVAADLRGGFAELARARERELARKPSSLSFTEAAAVPTAAVTALQCLRDHARLRAGQEVLVHGASGGVGTFAVQLARAFGAEVTAVCSSPNGDAVRALGAKRVVDYTREDFAAGPTRYDLIVGVNGNRSLLEYRRALAPGGAYVGLGGSIRQIMQAMLLGPLLSLFGGKRLRFMGVAKVSADDLRQLGELLATGKLTPVIDRTVPLAETREAIRYLTAGHARGKVVIDMAR